MSGTSHQPRKRFGQHFLSDATVLQQIVDCISPKVSDHFVEIGPGQGALTFELLSSGSCCDAIEIDRDLVRYLRRLSKDRLIIHEADALSVNFSEVVSTLPFRLVGNLPYNISTPLLFHFYDYIDHMIDMHFLLQKEVVDRMTAAVGTSVYGRLSVMTQYYATAIDVLHVPPEAFDPPPRVDSSVVRLVPRRDREPLDVWCLSQVVRCCFRARRKTIYNNLKAIIDRDTMISLGLDISLRPQHLSLNDCVRLTQYIENNDLKHLFK